MFVVTWNDLNESQKIIIKILIKSIIDKRFVFVSCFYPIKKGVIRHPIEEYRYKAQQLFILFNKNLQLFVFTNDEGEDILEISKKSYGPNIIFIKKYQNIYDVPQIAKRKKKYAEIGKLMKNCDFNVSAEIGAIWNAKIVFLQEVIEIYSVKSILIFWIDIGILKTEKMRKVLVPLEWPSIKRIEKIFSFEQDNEKSSVKTYTNKILFWGRIRTFNSSKSIDEINLENFEGFIFAGFFGGYKEKMLSFFDKYWKTQDIFMKKNQFVLREEFMIGSYLSMNKNDFFMTKAKKCQNCNMFESCMGFIDQENVCQLDNSVYVFVTKKGYYVPIRKKLGDWL